jgi:hypothetical protein
VPAGCLENLSGAWLHDEDPSWRYDALDDGGTVTLVVTRLELPIDAGFRPRRFRDAGTSDAGLDAGRPDSGLPDAGRADAGRDAGTSEHVLDGGWLDAGRDAGTSERALDGGWLDAGRDAGTSERALDGGWPDAGGDGGSRAASADASVSADAAVSVDAGNAPTSLQVRLTRTPAGFLGETTTTLQHPLGRVCEVRFKTEVLACTDGGLLLRTESATALGDSCEAPAKAQPVPMAEHHLHRP